MPRDFKISEISPPARLESCFDGKPPKLWARGDSAILNHPLLGILSARQIDSDLALKSSQLLRQLVSLKEAAFVSGWHSPLEEDALRIALAQDVSLVFCVSKALERFKPSDDLESRLNDGKVLLLTHCSPKAKRISRDASIRRNELVIALASALLILSAPLGSNTLNLAKEALRHGKRVLTIEHRMNEELLGCNALPATCDNILTVLG